MKRRVLTVVLLLSLAAPAALLAHDLSKHKGRQTKGEIVSIAQDRFGLKTAKGIQTVLLTQKPKFEKGNQPGALADLKKGEQVTVIGTTLASGEIVAREVLLGGVAPGSGHSAASAHAH